MRKIKLITSQCGKELMPVDGLAAMDGGKALLQIRGMCPFLSRKYDITKHPNYQLLSDFNPKNHFDIEKFWSTRLRSVRGSGTAAMMFCRRNWWNLPGKGGSLRIRSPPEMIHPNDMHEKLNAGRSILRFTGIGL